MAELLTFPGLGLEFYLNRVAFKIGGYSIAWYGVIMAAAFLVGICYVMLRTKKFGLDGDRVIDVLLVSVIGGIVGARLYFVAFSWSEYKDNLIDIFKTWEGGVAIYGGLIGGVVVGLIMCRLRKVRVIPMLDLTVGGLIIGQAIGRWGNFINIEAFGGNTSMPWGMAGPAVERYLTVSKARLEGIGVAIDPTMPVHPTFFYESIWCLLGFLIIAWFTNRRKFDGEIVLFYVMWYGAGRTVIEGMRTDSLMLGSVRISQLLSIIGVIAAAVLWVYIRNKIKKTANADYLKLYVNTEESAQILDGTFYTKNAADKADTTENTASLAEQDILSENEIKNSEDDSEKAGGENGSSS